MTEIYVKIEEEYIKINRIYLHTYPLDVQRLLGGRNEPDSTYEGLPCFHLPSSHIEKIKYVEICPNCYSRIKVLRTFLDPELIPTALSNDIVHCKFDFIAYMLKHYPPIKYLGIQNNKHRDTELENKIKDIYFPFSVNEYYCCILQRYGDGCSLFINSSKFIKDNPWVATSQIPLYVSGGDYECDLKYVDAYGGCFANVDNLCVRSEKDIIFTYAKTLVIKDISRFVATINCKFLIILSSWFNSFGKANAEIIVSNFVIDAIGVKYWLYTHGISKTFMQKYPNTIFIQYDTLNFRRNKFKEDALIIDFLKSRGYEI